MINPKGQQLAWLVGAYAVAVALLGGSVWHAYRVLAGHTAVLAGPAGVPSAREAARTADRTVDTRQIIATHLFGAPPEAVAAVETSVPETRLKLTLFGVAASDVPAYARAIIAVERGEARSYSLGERVDKTDAEVRAIRGDHVLLDRRGALESLYLVKPEPGRESPGGVAAPGLLPVPEPAASEPAAAEAGAEPAAGQPPAGDGTPESLRKLLEEFTGARKPG